MESKPLILYRHSLKNEISGVDFSSAPYQFTFCQLLCLLWRKHPFLPIQKPAILTMAADKERNVPTEVLTGLV